MSGEFSDAPKVLEFVRQDGPVESRLKETPDGNIEFLQWGALPFSDLSLGEQQILDGLNELEGQGLLVRSGRVHPHDTCEYIISWDVPTQGAR